LRRSYDKIQGNVENTNMSVNFFIFEVLKYGKPNI